MILQTDLFLIIVIHIKITGIPGILLFFECIAPCSSGRVNRTTIAPHNHLRRLFASLRYTLSLHGKEIQADG